MRKRIQIILFALIIFTLIAPFLFPTFIEAGNVIKHDPWGQKEVLNYLFWTADDKLSNDCKKLQTDLGLSDEQMERLKDLGLKEHLELMDMSLPERNTLTVEEGSKKVTNVFSEIDKETRDLLGPKYNDFRKWIRDWWSDEQIYRENWIREKESQISISSDFSRGLVYATQYNGNTSFEVALPDK